VYGQRGDDEDNQGDARMNIPDLTGVALTVCLSLTASKYFDLRGSIGLFIL
jgi:hypothetical protein